MAFVTGTVVVGAVVTAAATAIGYAADETGDAISKSIKWGIAGSVVYFGGRHLLKKGKR